MMTEHKDDQSKPISLKMVLRLILTLKPYKKQYTAVCMFGLIVAVLEMIPPRLVGYSINEMSSGHFSMKPILITGSIWTLVFLIAQTFHSFQISIANRYGEKVLTGLRQQMFDHLQNLSMSYFDRTHAGRIIARVTNDIDAVRNILIWGVNTLVANTAIMIFASTMIFCTDVKLFFAVAWLAPAMTLLNFLYGKKVGTAWQKVRKHSTRVSSNQAENIAGMRVVAAYNRQEQNLEVFSELQENNTRNNVAASALSGLFQPVIQWVRFIGQAIILLYGGYRISMGSLRPGDVVAVSLYWEWFMQPAASFGAFFNELLMSMSGAERMFALLDEEPEIQDAPTATNASTFNGRVRFNHVNFGYTDKRAILKDLSFEVPAGSTVALVGGTGSGKSTILNLLARFYPIQGGNILVDDHDIHQITGDSLHHQMAMVLQNNYLFTGTVIENLRSVRPDATDEMIYEAAKKLDCHDRFLRMSNGYHTQVGERGSALSLGERQLICFTRALVADPKILLLDEATSAVDLWTELQIQKALSKLVTNRTTFIVAHRLSTIMNADLILVLEKGAVVERGNHAELMALGGKYAQLHLKANLNKNFSMYMPAQLA